MKTILVAVDLSDVTIKVVKVAVHLAKPFQSKIILMHASEHAPQLSVIGLDAPPPGFVDETNINEELSRLQEMISSVGLESTKVELQGPPVESILGQVENYRIDLIVLGSHSRGIFHYLFTGSVVDGILQRAKCPVLIVPSQE